MEKIILNEFLGESGDMGVTQTNLHDLTRAINAMPIGNFTMPTLLHIQRASQALDALDLIMNTEEKPHDQHE